MLRPVLGSACGEGGAGAGGVVAGATGGVLNEIVVLHASAVRVSVWPSGNCTVRVAVIVYVPS